MNIQAPTRQTPTNKLSFRAHDFHNHIHVIVQGSRSAEQYLAFWNKLARLSREQPGKEILVEDGMIGELSVFELSGLFRKFPKFTLNRNTEISILDIHKSFNPQQKTIILEFFLKFSAQVTFFERIANHTPWQSLIS